MKNRIRITGIMILLPILTFIAGVWISIWQISQLYDPYTRSMKSILSKYQALVLLRSNDTEEAISILETQLDGELMLLSNLDETKDSEKKEQLRRLLGEVRIYRDKYPRGYGIESTERIISKTLSYGITNSPNHH